MGQSQSSRIRREQNERRGEVLKLAVRVDAELYNHLRSPLAPEAPSDEKTVMSVGEFINWYKAYGQRIKNENAHEMSENLIRLSLDHLLTCLGLPTKTRNYLNDDELSLSFLMPASFAVLPSNPKRNQDVSESATALSSSISERSHSSGDIKVIALTAEALKAQQQNIHRLDQLEEARDADSMTELSDNARSISTRRSTSSRISSKSYRNISELKNRKSKPSKLSRLPDETEAQLRVRQAAVDVLSPYRLRVLDKLKAALKSSDALDNLGRMLKIEDSKRVFEHLLTLISSLLKDGVNRDSLNHTDAVVKETCDILGLEENERNALLSYCKVVTGEEDQRPDYSTKQLLAFLARFAFVFAIKPNYFFVKNPEAESKNTPLLQPELASYFEDLSKNIFSPLSEKCLTPLCRAYINELRNMSEYSEVQRYELITLLMVETTCPDMDLGVDEESNTYVSVDAILRNVSSSPLKKALISNIKNKELDNLLDSFQNPPSLEERKEYLEGAAFLMSQRPNEFMTFNSNTSLKEAINSKAVQTKAHVAHNEAKRLEKLMNSIMAEQEREKVLKQQAENIILEEDEEYCRSSPSRTPIKARISRSAEDADAQMLDFEAVANNLVPSDAHLMGKFGALAASRSNSPQHQRVAKDDAIAYSSGAQMTVQKIM